MTNKVSFGTVIGLTTSGVYPLCKRLGMCVCLCFVFGFNSTDDLSLSLLKTKVLIEWLDLVVKEQKVDTPKLTF